MLANASTVNRPLASRRALPGCDVDRVGRGDRLGLRPEHQAIALKDEEPRLIGAGEVRMGSTIYVVRHRSRVLFHTVRAEVPEVRIERVRELLGGCAAVVASMQSL